MSSMSKKIATSAVALLLAAGVVFGLLIYEGAFSTFLNADFDRDAYRSAVIEMYRSDTPEMYEQYAKGETFAFSRLMVNDFNGRDYGEKLCAYDAENDFAVLQFASPAEAERAYYKIQADGMLVDPEGTAELCASEKGSIYPEASNALGTPQYLSKYAMGSDDVVVALIDTGVMTDHEAYNGRFVSRGYDYSEDGCADAYFDTEMRGNVYGHATFIAGILADNTPDTVKILPYKVVPFDMSTALASSVVNAINDAVSSGAKVINLSVSCSTGAASFRAAVKNAKANDVCLCAAAGNQATELKTSYPAAIEETVTVSALETDFKTFASFSNYGALIDFCAPGRKVVSTAPYVTDADVRYRKNSGTSFASPYIAALCADLKTINHDMPVDDVCRVLSDFATDLGTAGKDDYFGWGMPDISAMEYTDGDSYAYQIPEGTLSVYGTKDYTEDTQPWRIFADRLISVTVDDAVERIGNYNFYNVKRATFTKSENIDKIGDYAFYGCENVKSITFTENCTEVGVGAFGGIENMVINGYRNTPAESYALSESITFNALGCKHHYTYEVIDPTDTEEGYTLYTCTVCGDSYVGAYIVPALVDEGACGDDLTYSFYDTGKLTIDGSGAMYPYLHTAAPWSDYADEIDVLEIKAGVGSISQFAFYGCDHLTKIRCSALNTQYAAADNVLYSKDLSELVLVPGGTAYVMPDFVTAWTPQSLLLNTAVQFNRRFTEENNIVYDKDGNIICALPSFNDETLNLSDDITVGEFAFILTSYPETLCADTTGITYGDYAIGYRFDGRIMKREMTVYTYDSGTTVTYAKQNDFSLHSYNKGACGESARWYYDTQNKKLSISGQGALPDYTAVGEVPWGDYLDEVKEVVISDSITSLGNYSFYGASALLKVTMPLSLKAPQNTTVWYGCENIARIELTYGSGYMDDYADDNYTYFANTPWYISRANLSALHLDENVLYIGREAFRSCNALKEITLSKCESIADDAFLNCANLKKFTLTSKQCAIADYALFAYRAGDYAYYSVPVMYGFADSTAKDYCAAHQLRFVSVGCGHTRSTTLKSSVEYDCCFESEYVYECLDCAGVFTQYVPTTNGHYVTGVAKSVSGRPIADADVYIDGVLSAVTARNGAFVAEDIKCGTHTLTLSRDGDTFIAAEIVVDKSNTTGDFTFPYGDYLTDGIVNGRDLAFAKQNDISDYRSFDYGSTVPELTLSEPEGDDILPYTTDISIDDYPGSDYRKVTTVDIINPGNYTMTAMGFLYGKEVTDDELMLEKADTYGENGYLIRHVPTSNVTELRKQLLFGIKNKDSWFNVRFYIIYTNGVNTHIYYSDACRYDYRENV